MVTRPPGPVPVTAERSTPSAAATRAATGETLTPSGAAAGAAGASEGALPFPSAAAEALAPASIRAITWPTVTVSPASARISVIVPLAGAGSSTSTLSVEISTIVWPSETWSPGATCQSRSVPSVTDSPASGVTMSITRVSVSSPAGAEPFSPVPAEAPLPAAEPLPFPSPALISAITAPTVTVSPSGAWIFRSVPATGEGISASTLSVETSTSVSPTST